MARAERRRDSRAKPPTGHDRYESAYVGTEGLFFQRLRRQAKWMFVLLAAVFAIGFVAFGVGSDVQGGIADAIQGGGSAGQPSIEDARERLEEKPNDPQALRDLATALLADGQLEEAIESLETYTALRPRDQEALRELAGLYLNRASRHRDTLQAAQLEAQLLSPGADFRPPPTTELGQALGTPPITGAVTGRANERVNAAFTAMTSSFEEAKATYQQLARLDPEDASIQLQLADAAQNASDTQTALAAYRRFLKLAPDDPSAELVREEIKRLEESASLGSTPVTSG